MPTDRRPRSLSDVSSRPVSRAPLWGEEPRTLQWCSELEHAAATRVRVRLVASLVKVQRLTQKQPVPRCSIQVWVEGANKDVRLAESSGSICPKNLRGAAHVAWLGRPKERPQGHCEVGWRFAEPPGEPAEGLEEAEKEDCRAGRTMAEATLGVLAAVARLFGARTVELGAEDTGSGKLIRFYSNLGFKELGLLQRIGRAEQQMIAPIEVIAGLAPETWMRGIVPDSFDAWPWLWSLVWEPSMETVLDAMGFERKWAWKIAWPLGASVAAQLLCDDKNGKINFEAVLRGSRGTELAIAKSVARVQQAVLRLSWLGRSGSAAVHPSVKGRSPEGELVARGPTGGAGGPTLALALLGVIAALGRWLGCSRLETTAVDDGSGRLLDYLRGVGFKEQGPAGRAAATKTGPASMVADCAELARACCPEDWRGRLPADAELSALRRTVGGLR